MDQNKKAKRLIKKLGYKFGSVSGAGWDKETFSLVIESIKIADIKEHIKLHLGKYRKLFLRYASEERSDSKKTEPTEETASEAKQERECQSRKPPSQQNENELLAEEIDSSENKRSLNGDAQSLPITHKKQHSKKKSKSGQRSAGTGKVQKEVDVFYNLYKSKKHDGLDSLPKNIDVYGHLLPILLQKPQGEDIWKRFCEMKGNDKEKDRFQMLAQYAVGEATLLLKLMDIFLDLIPDERFSVSETHHFLKLFHMKKTLLGEEFPKQKYIDLMAAILSVYIDNIVMSTRNTGKETKVGKKLSSFVSYLLADSPVFIIDAILQAEHLTDEDAVLLKPLFRKAFEALKIDSKLSVQTYARGLCLVAKTKNLLKEESNVLKTMFESLPVPESFQEWLTDHGIKEAYHIDTNNPDSFIASLMMALSDEDELSGRQRALAAEEDDTPGLSPQRQELDQLFFIDTKADQVTKDMFPAEEEAELVSGPEDGGDDGSVVLDNQVEENVEGESHYGAIVAETLKSIRKLTEEKQDDGFKEKRMSSADFFEDSDVEVLDVRVRNDGGRFEEEKDVDESKLKGEDRLTSAEGQEELAEQSDSDISIIEVSGDLVIKISGDETSEIKNDEDDSDKGKGSKLESPRKVLGESPVIVARSAPEDDTCKESHHNLPKKGDSLISAEKEGLQRGPKKQSPSSRISDELPAIPMADAETSSQICPKKQSQLDSPRKDSNGSPLANAETGSQKRQLRQVQPTGTPNSLKKVLGSSPEAAAKRSSQESSKKRITLDSPKEVCDLPKITGKTALRDMPVSTEDPSEKEPSQSVKLREKRIKERLSTPRMSTRSDDVKEDVTPVTPRRRTHSQTAHTSQCGISQSPLKEVTIDNDCEISKNRLKLHFPEDNVIIEEVDDSPMSVPEDDEEQFLDEPLTDADSKVSVSVVHNKSKAKTPVTDKSKEKSTKVIKTQIVGAVGNLTQFDFHSSSSEGEDAHVQLPNPRRSMTKIKARSVDISRESPLKSVGTPRKGQKSRSAFVKEKPETTVSGKAPIMGEALAVKGSDAEASDTRATPDGGNKRGKTPKSKAFTKTKEISGTNVEKVSMISPPKDNSATPTTGFRKRGAAVRELEMLKQDSFFSQLEISPEGGKPKRRYSLRHPRQEADDIQSSMLTKCADQGSETLHVDVFGTPRAAATYSGKKRRRSELPKANSDITLVESPSMKQCRPNVKRRLDTPSK